MGHRSEGRQANVIGDSPHKKWKRNQVGDFLSQESKETKGLCGVSGTIIAESGLRE